MKVIRNINNNVSVCVTGTGVEVVAFGKGIGFRTPPYEVSLNQIERTFYDVNPAYLDVINSIPAEILNLSAKIVDLAREVIDSPISSNVVFTLADHINFAIRRNKANMAVKLPLLYDVEHLMEKEMMVGIKALELLKKDLRIYLPKEEASSIALHIANAEAARESGAAQRQDENVIERITQFIEDFFEITIDREGYNFSRYAMHIRYLIRRGEKNELISSEDTSLYDSLSQAAPQIRECVDEIALYFQESLKIILTKEECMYLMLYTYRFCSREDCEVET